ncbi:MAG: hypothetical protein AAFQ42_01895 [Pseudomonadota bacterium]
MTRLLTAYATAAAITAAFSSTTALAASVTIERQCTRYAHFCGKEAVHAHQVAKHKASRHGAQARTRKDLVVRRAFRPSLVVIERQCERYGHFC